MGNTGLGLRGIVRLGASSSQDDRPSAGFEELAIPLFDSLYNFARWLVHNKSNAEDLVQETYLKALRSFASFQPGTNFRAWMFRILRNTFLSSCSTLDRRMTVEIDSEDDVLVLPATFATPESLLTRKPFRTQSSTCRSSSGKSFYCAMSKMRLTRRSRRYCRSRWELLCRA
jgi:DNA-directed RNA polymerase specialized sigma24 family protein